MTGVCLFLWEMRFTRSIIVFSPSHWNDSVHSILFSKLWMVCACWPRQIAAEKREIFSEFSLCSINWFAHCIEWFFFLPFTFTILYFKTSISLILCDFIQNDCFFRKWFEFSTWKGNFIRCISQWISFFKPQSLAFFSCNI